jgi:hypothetical protein
MKKTALLTIILLVAFSAGFGQKVTLRLGAGWETVTGGDLATGIQGQSDYLAATYTSVGSYKVPHGGWIADGEFVIHLSPRFGIGVGAGYLRHVQESRVTYTVSTIATAEKIMADIRVIPITLNLHYQVPVSSRLRIDMSAGAGYYLTTWNWAYRMDLSLSGYTGYDQYTFKSNKGAIGFQGGLNLEYDLAANFAFVLGVTGRFASIDKFLGSWTDKGGGDFWEFDDAGNDHFAWYYDWLVGGRTFGQLAFQPSQPAGSTTSNARYAKVDLTGFAATAGFKIGFGR